MKSNLRLPAIRGVVGFGTKSTRMRTCEIPGRTYHVVQMAQGLQLTQGLALQQVLSPQMQQSLALLQAPIMELRAMVEQEMTQNPVLEEVPASERSPEPEAAAAPATNPLDPAEPPSDVLFDPATEKANGA